MLISERFFFHVQQTGQRFGVIAEINLARNTHVINSFFSGTTRYFKLWHNRDLPPPLNIYEVAKFSLRKPICVPLLCLKLKSGFFVNVYIRLFLSSPFKAVTLEAEDFLQWFCGRLSCFWNFLFISRASLQGIQDQSYSLTVMLIWSQIISLTFNGYFLVK